MCSVRVTVWLHGRSICLLRALGSIPGEKRREGGRREEKRERKEVESKKEERDGGKIDGMPSGPL